MDRTHGSYSHYIGHGKYRSNIRHLIQQLFHRMITIRHGEPCCHVLHISGKRHSGLLKGFYAAVKTGLCRVRNLCFSAENPNIGMSQGNQILNRRFRRLRIICADTGQIGKSQRLCGVCYQHTRNLYF